MKNQRLMIMGPGPNSGKTLLSVGLCRALTQRGIRVAPFKAISVVRQREGQSNAPPIEASGITHHYRASRQPFKTIMNPIVLRPINATIGELYVHGEPMGSAEFILEDMLMVRRLSANLQTQLRQVVEEAFRQVVAEYEYVVIEGASSPVDMPEEEDIPNIMIAKLAQSPIVLCCKFSRGGGAASLVGTTLLLPSDIRAMLRGFVLSDVNDEIMEAHCSKTVESMTGLSRLGSIPPIKLWDGLPDTNLTEEMYDKWGQAVSQARVLENVGLA